jgi:hypothetical protein
MSMRMSRVTVVAVSTMVLMLLSTNARADGFAIPYFAINFGGNTGNDQFDFEDVGDSNQLSFGGVVGHMAGGIFGGEFDIAYTKNFFGDAPGVEGNSLLTLMPALIIGIPIGGQKGGGVRPYAIAGIGTTKRDVTVNGLEVFDGWDLAYAFGGGVTVYFSNHVGVNAEYRYLRNFEVDEISVNGVDVDNGTFNFHRAAFGVAFRY